MAEQAPGERPPELVLALDVDGVLLDAERAGRGRWQETLRDAYGVDPARLDEVFFRRSWADVIVGRESIEVALGQALDELGWDIDVEALLRCWFEADFEIDHDVVRAVNEWATPSVRVAGYQSGGQAGQIHRTEPRQ